MQEYTIKDLIFGSRLKYLEIERYLSILKELTICHDKAIKDLVKNFYYYISSINLKLCCDYEKNSLRGIYGNAETEVKKIKDEYVVKGDFYNTSIISQARFASTIDMIENSDFLKQINFGDFFTEGNNRIEVSPGCISVFDEKYEFVPIINYLSRTDTLRYLPDDLENNKEELLKILNMKFSADNLSNYHRNLIENSLAITKPLDIQYDEIYDEFINLSVHEDEKKLILKPYRKKLF